MAKRIATISEAARHLGLSRAAVHDLANQGLLIRNGSGVDLDATRLAYLKHLRERRVDRGETALRQAKAREIELRTAERERRLIEYDEAAAVLAECIGVVLTQLGGFPARMAGRDLGLRRWLDDGVRICASASAMGIATRPPSCGGLTGKRRHDPAHAGHRSSRRVFLCARARSQSAPR
jgi:hypothetical protein